MSDIKAERTTIRVGAQPGEVKKILIEEYSYDDTKASQPGSYIYLHKKAINELASDFAQGKLVIKDFKGAIQKRIQRMDKHHRRPIE